ncbi:MAG: pilus assembly protein [Methylococcales bacterium]|nr:pilus assembly protein [Methylococcales bacterium]MBT7408239.1 pilus assembly protein [Methylococcales bacterium]
MAMKTRQLGQGMSEYIIIVALVAVAAIGVAGFFGDTIEHQMAAMSEEISGGNGGNSIQSSVQSAGKANAAATIESKMGTYDTKNN